MPRLLAELLAARLPRVPTFGDRPRGDEALCRLATSAAGSAPAVIVAAQHLAEAEGAAASLAGWVDAAVAMLVAADRDAEAVELLERSAAQAQQPAWRAAGWLLRAAELRIGLGQGPGGFEIFVRPLATLGIEAPSQGESSRASFVGVLARAAALTGWPGEPEPRAALARLVQRNLLLLNQLITFSPLPRGVMRVGLLTSLVARVAGEPAERRAARVMQAYGAGFFGHAWLARRLLPPPQAMPALPDNPRMDAHMNEGAIATRIALGDWPGVMSAVDAGIHRFAAVGYGRGEAECRALGALLSFYEGRLADAAQRFREVTEFSLRRPGNAWRAWGPVGEAETGFTRGELDAPALRALIDRVAQLMTELENIDNAYTLRRLALESRLAWMRDDAAAAREALLAAVATMSRVPRCGFWAHEGYAGLGEGLLRLRAHELRVGGALPPVDDAWRLFAAALGRHAARFPAGRALVHRLRGQAALARGDRARGVGELGRAVALAERQGLKVELARACQALGEATQDQTPLGRARRLWADMGARPA